MATPPRAVAATAAAAAATTTMYVATHRPFPGISGLLEADQRRLYTLQEAALQWVHHNVATVELSAADRASPSAPAKQAQLVKLVCSTPQAVGRTDSEGNCCVHLFAAAGFNALLLQLPRDAVQPNVCRVNRDGNTPLHIALQNVDVLGAPPAKNPMWCMCQTLLRLGAGPSLAVRNRRGISPAYMILCRRQLRLRTPNAENLRPAQPPAATSDDGSEAAERALTAAIEKYCTWCLSTRPDADSGTLFPPGGKVLNALYNAAWDECMFGENARYHAVSVPTSSVVADVAAAATAAARGHE